MKIKNKALLIAIAISVICSTAMGKKKVDISSDQKYSNLIGSKYKTKVDLIVYQFDDSKEFILGAYGEDDLPSKDQIKNNFPYRYYSLKLLGVLPEGSLLVPSRVTYEGNSANMFTYVRSAIAESPAKDFLGKEVNTTFLAVDNLEPTTFKPEYFEAVK